MNPSSLRPLRLLRTADVCLRQRSPGQARQNREGHQRQQGLVEHVATLGWATLTLVIT
jgi:hypothetical protein